ncbi:hypothetical protein E8K88_02575 [Lampropedia aestuarii]|uniref:Uncharacterized protein n=1 Tax=Lampropedia aestuarii TaxID=2562762 RepID=A0A4S5C141_9BURK|nr:hypothetical protein [Lampropedia aestuarii]THJ36168.1 hypothetical protein E8K88_02575 [Lampropedia aestuarii]
MPITDLKSKAMCDSSRYFEEKALHDLEVSDLAFIHLDRILGFQRLSNCTLYTSLHDLMNTAQASFNNNRTRIYTPLLACFAVLDQIGGAYGSKSKSTNYRGGIKIALDLFGTYTENEIEKLYALRNGLYHDGSLLSVSTNKKTNVIFRISEETTNTITHPKQEWDGIYHDDINQYITTINTKKFKNDIENIITKCTNDLLTGSLEMKINCPREFFYKFLFAKK